MKRLTYPVWRENETRVDLADLLAVVPETTLVWSILDFDGVGVPPRGLHMDDFEDLLHKSPSGLIMPWSELKQFSDGVFQACDCIVVGARTEQDILRVDMKKDDYSSCEVALVIFDCYSWSVWAHDAEFLKRFESVY